MKTVGFPISHKENEKRRALVPNDISLMKCPNYLFFEYGYGEVLGISDEEYRCLGCHVTSREEVLRQNIICDPKVGDADYLQCLKNQTVFGWIHATQNKPIADILVYNKLTGIAWENMYYKGRHVFWRNNELAGEAAVIHAFQCFGRMPYEIKAAVIGRGNTARGAIKILNMLGAEVVQYDRHSEKLFREELAEYDVIVNCVLWDIKRTDHIIYKNDLAKMKRNSMIIDVSCDRNGGIETSIPTTIESPTYFEDGVLHYVVDHTPSIFYKTFSEQNSHLIYNYLDSLIIEEANKVIEDAVIVREGEIMDNSIIEFQRLKNKQST